MSLPKRYNPGTSEPQIQQFWRENSVYHYVPDDSRPLFTIDTPPPTVSGHLHLGHVYSYTHTDLVARFWRMNGFNVFYPMGYDDNGLPTERLVQRQHNVSAADIGRQAFIERCLEVSEKAEHDYESLWQRLGLSVDWRYTYRSIGPLARRTSQWSFLDLYHKDLVYRQQAPAIWCPECQTAIAQAELDVLERERAFYTLIFTLEDGTPIEIATTRPELLPACVAIFVHPGDPRYQSRIGQQATVPLFGQRVPILADRGADPEKGTGVVMCCTFGDTDDVQWWRTHNLPLIEAIGRDGKLTPVAGEFAGQSTATARQQIIDALGESELLASQTDIQQYVRIHERCDTPVEYIVTPQWFVRVLEFKETWLRIGDQIDWYPPQMKNRYLEWVENLNWDWCISRQRYFGVPFPVWYRADTGDIVVPDVDELPLDPLESKPRGYEDVALTSETDVMDTWATSSVTPQIVGQMLNNPALYERVFPMNLRPQAHEIIRTWAFYTIVKSYHHFGQIPWQTIAISGWGLAPEGQGKLSKSRGGGPVAPLTMIESYSADAVRYWASSTGPGKDSVISEEKIQTGAKLATKLWNVARFSQRFLDGYQAEQPPPALSTADRWILARLMQLIERATTLFHQYDYAAARSEIEGFFWRDLSDNYLEMAKQRLYDTASSYHPGAKFTLHRVLESVIALFAPFLPYVTDRIYQAILRRENRPISVHLTAWPQVNPDLNDQSMLAVGEALIEIATAVRRFKSENQIALTTPLAHLHIDPQDDALLAAALAGAQNDLASVTRAEKTTVGNGAPNGLTALPTPGKFTVALRVAS